MKQAEVSKQEETIEGLQDELEQVYRYRYIRECRSIDKHTYICVYMCVYIYIYIYIYNI